MIENTIFDVCQSSEGLCDLRSSTNYVTVCIIIKKLIFFKQNQSQSELVRKVQK